jgi:hypothetical protein
MHWLTTVCIKRNRGTIWFRDKSIYHVASMIDHALIILRETKTWEVVLGNQRDSFTWHPWVIPNVQCGQSFVDGRLPHRSEAMPVLPILLQPINHREDIWWFPLLSVHKSASVMLGLALSNIVNLESCKMETKLESAMLLRHLSNPNKQYITARQESARMLKKLENWRTQEVKEKRERSPTGGNIAPEAWNLSHALSLPRSLRSNSPPRLF